MTNKISDSEHLQNLCKIASIDDFEEEVMPKLKQYLTYFGLIQDSYWSRPDINLEELVQSVLEDINPNT